MGKRVYFMSDMHLGAHYLPDPREAEARVVRFLESIAADAAELYLLGDVLDYWFEFRTVVPRGHVRFFGALARLADAGVRITWLVGNHDVWLRDYLAGEVGLEVVENHTVRTIMGRRFLLSHGDDVGRQPGPYRFARWCFHNRVCQVLYAAIHPRWTSAVAMGWSTNNRTRRWKAARVETTPAMGGRANLLQFSADHHRQHPDVDHYVYGHLHLADQERLDSGATVTILGDWIRQFTYAVFDGEQLQLLKWEE